MCTNLHALTSETVTWNWLKIHEKEFEDTKTAITNVMTLTTFDMNKDAAVITNGSCQGLGFLLYQTSKENEKKSVIQIGSTGLKPRETLCSPVELESMAIRYMIKKTDHYLRACPHFKNYTDCKAIPPVQREIVNIRNITLQKLFLDLSEYNYEIIHIEGKNNLICDALSRSPTPGETYQEDMLEETNQDVMMNNIFICQANVKLVADTDTIEDLNLQEIKEHIESDEDYEKLITAF